QVLHAIARDVLHGVDPGKARFAGNPAVGEYLKSRIFAPGRSLDWNGLTRHATGEMLNAKAFAAEIGRERSVVARSVAGSSTPRARPLCGQARSCRAGFDAPVPPRLGPGSAAAASRSASPTARSRTSVLRVGSRRTWVRISALGKDLPVRNSTTPRASRSTRSSGVSSLASQSLTAPSPPAEARVRPSGLKATPSTTCRRPRKVRAAWPVAISRDWKITIPAYVPVEGTESFTMVSPLNLTAPY